MSKRGDQRLILALEEETNSLLYLFSLTWSMGKGWLTLRQVYNHPGGREDIPHGKPWPPSFVYQTIETKDAREKFSRSLTLGEEKEVLASAIEELEEEISQSSTNYSTDQSQTTAGPGWAGQLVLDYLLTRISCPLFKTKPHIRTLKTDLQGY